MALIFSVWEKTKQFGNPKELSALFEECLTEISSLRVWSDAIADYDIDFQIVDVRQSSWMGISSETVEEFVKIVQSLLLPEYKLPQTLKGQSRLLFVGSTGLAKWEDEAKKAWEDEAQNRSIKKDVEFIIRTLQSYRLARYVFVESAVPVPNSFSAQDEVKRPDLKPLILSALLSFARWRPQDEISETRLGFKSLKEDINDLLITVRRLGPFSSLGYLEAKPNSKEFRADLLMNEIRLLFQLGKRNRESEWDVRSQLEAARQTQSTFQMVLPDSSYELGYAIDEQIAIWATDADITPDGTYENPTPKIAQRLAATAYKFKRYELLRDLGRVIGSAALPTLREKRDNKKILIIDDFVYSDVRDRKTMRLDQLKTALALVGWLDDCVVTQARYIRCFGDPLNADRYSVLFDGNVDFRSLAKGDEIEASSRPESYAVIVMDPEAGSDQYGPERLERLANYLKEVAKGPDCHDRRIDRDHITDVPRIIAFSQRESSGNVQQCLNLGAWAFVNKGREFQLLFEMSRALKVMKKIHRDYTEQASHFRILNSLKPSARSELRRADGSTYLHGGMYGEKIDDSNYKDVIDDPREYDWIRELPKADLHCHIGTAISFSTVELLALNTVGYMLAAESSSAGPLAVKNEKSKNSKSLPQFSGQSLITRVARAVVLAEKLALNIEEKLPVLSPLILLAAATAGVTGSATLLYKRFGLGDMIIKSLIEPNDRVEEFQVAGLLVGMLANYAQSDSPEDAESNPTPVSKYLERIALNWEELSSNPPSPGGIGFDSRLAWKVAIRNTELQLRQSAGRWDGYYTREAIRKSFAFSKGQKAKVDQHPERNKGDIDTSADLDSLNYWRNLDHQFQGRIEIAQNTIEAAISDAEAWLVKKGAGANAAIETTIKWLKHVGVDPEKLRINRKFSVKRPKNEDQKGSGLEKYVCIDKHFDLDGLRSGLQLYLRGADLLGSAHLQYPDNLLLAGYSIARDSVLENIIYSEIRCETTGYTKGGMGAQDATEILLNGFNMAVLSLATETKPLDRHTGTEGETWPIVRINILLAAKRHKTEPEARKVVALLEGYLERRPGDADQSFSRGEYPDIFPRWWRPADVVGFDISGDESQRKDWLEAVVKPLAESSSPITIHAGEAASAENIWYAVYSLNATRIGHGLRLAEDVALLGYCVREGICMEMCPNSNHFTNGFRFSKLSSAESMPSPHNYPLLDYMSRGLEVTIATDNRYLHPAGRRTLTSEYITASRLVGGMTQWEVLQIVKAGFKNAFLDKFEVSEMICAVEEKIYGIIAAAP